MPVKSKTSTDSKQLFIFEYFLFQIANISWFEAIDYLWIFSIPSQKYQLILNNCLPLNIFYYKYFSNIPISQTIVHYCMLYIRKYYLKNKSLNEILQFKV